MAPTLASAHTAVVLLALFAARAAFADDECAANPGEDEDCGLSMLQRKGRGVTGEVAPPQVLPTVTIAPDPLPPLPSLVQVEENSSIRYCQDRCWADYGFKLGDCKCDIHHGWYMWICWKRNGERIKTEYGHQFNCHGLSKPPPPKPAPPPPPSYTSTLNPLYKVMDKRLVENSSAPLMTFHLFRVQSETNYSCCANADLTTAGAAMFYLHNEIVWHAKTRAGTNFADPKTRIVRYKVLTKATQPLWELGMNFGVMNEFDITQCTGPFDCENFQRFGYTVGCENWVEGSAANFPHQKWNLLNKYPKTSWFSLPGPCPLSKLGQKSKECVEQQPGGRCPDGMEPNGQGDCTFITSYAGEVKIDDLVGISNYQEFIDSGGREYDRMTDQGVHMNFWDGRFDSVLDEWRTAKLLELFDKTYPTDPTIEAPE
ncbi:Uncharacterized protein SCF082_LOCUS16306, partial [Durusdinium trenchii]